MIRMSQNVIAFSNGDVDIYKKFADYYNHYRAVNLGVKNVEYDDSIKFEQKTEKLHEEIEKTIAKVAGSNETVFSDNVWRTNPYYRWAAFQVIGALVDTILPDTILADFGAFAEVRVGGYGDTFTFDVDSNDLFIVSKAGKGKRHAQAQRQYKGQVHLIPERRMITVEEDLYRILAGKRNLAEYAVKMVKAIETEISIDVYNAINSTFSTLPANFKAGSYTQNSFIELAQLVTAANGGAKCAVFGTKLALSKVLPTNEYLKVQLGNEYNKAGYLTTFMNVDLFEIPQKIDSTNGDYAFALDKDALYFISVGSDKLVKVALEGELVQIADGQYANANLVQTTTMNKGWAAALITNSKYGIMKAVVA